MCHSNNIDGSAVLKDICQGDCTNIVTISAKVGIDK